MNLGTQIAALRKKQNMTQEALAQKLRVTNQAVSKWESGQCCPDVQLLPQIADIFAVSLDELFGRKVPVKDELDAVEDDGVLKVMLFCGGKRIESYDVCNQVEIRWNGPVLNLQSDCNVICEEVQGNVDAGGTVNCDEVQGDVHAGGNVNCDDVQGHVQAGGNVACDDVQGNVHAGGNVTCDRIEGNVTAGREVRCD